MAILVAGPSIKELEKRIGELRHGDICYFGSNNFVHETHILRQIDKHLSVFMCSALRAKPSLIEGIIEFLNRDEDNMFVSSFWRDAFGLMDDDFDLNQFLSTYDEKLIFFYLSYSQTVPNRDYPLHFISGNSLQVLIQLAIIGKAPRIVLFGADGSSEDIEEYYYRQGDYRQGGYERTPGLRERLIVDTNQSFNPIMSISVRNVYQTYNIPPIDILNCSEKSFYTPFPKISYDDVFEYLLTGKKFDRKSDLRIPKVSIISPIMNTKDSPEEMIKSVANQSYSNHEHIILFNEADDKPEEVTGQFPQVRWISEKECNSLQAFRKGISIARGEYIYYCPVTNLYANRDWLNTCVGIMENQPETSLVWGLCQHMSNSGAPGRITNARFLDNPPPQGKEFIYYWFKKKPLFPEGNLCVRKRVLEECFPSDASDAVDEREAWLAFNYKFNTSGYIPLFVPVVANYHRTYSAKVELRRLEDGYNVPPFYFVFLTTSSDAERQETVTDEGWYTLLDTYYDNIQQYKKLLLRGKVIHHYRNGNGEVLPDYISRNSFLSHGIWKYVRKRLPKGCLLTYENARSAWRKFRWSILRVIAVRIVRRLLGF
ncbi:glycosyltransferase [Chloroflexota bacterium]